MDQINDRYFGRDGHFFMYSISNLMTIAIIVKTTIMIS